MMEWEAIHVETGCTTEQDSPYETSGPQSSDKDSKNSTWRNILLKHQILH